MANITYDFSKAIKAGGNYALGAAAPLDCRLSVNTIEERDAHVTGNRAYPGMMVYVCEEAKTYLYDGTSWKILATSTSDDGNADINDISETDIEALFSVSST